MKRLQTPVIFHNLSQPYISRHLAPKIVLIFNSKFPILQITAGPSTRWRGKLLRRHLPSENSFLDISQKTSTSTCTCGVYAAARKNLTPRGENNPSQWAATDVRYDVRSDADESSKLYLRRLWIRISNSTLWFLRSYSDWLKCRDFWTTKT